MYVIVKRVIRLLTETRNKNNRKSRRILRNSAIFAVTLGASWLICIWLQIKTTLDAYATDIYVPLIFVLAVMLISLLTDGYLYGILASLVSVLGVNWAFTYPYRELNFSIYGYPTTFIIMLAVSVVISALVSRLQEHERLKRETEQEKLRATLLRAISHDLRTPLTGIIGSISAVLDDNGISADQENLLLSDAKQDAEWLVRMVENLLSITRISSNEETSIVKTPEAIEEIIGECAAKFRKRNPDVELEIKVPEELVMANVDAMLMAQVLMNLMDNAVHHGKCTKKVSVEMSTQGENVEIKVSDDGEGIPKEVIPNLFKSQLAPSDSNKFRGIGLAVCKTIVSAHGGEIRARNIPDSGAEFSFTIPMGDESDEH